MYEELWNLIEDFIIRNYCVQVKIQFEGSDFEACWIFHNDFTVCDYIAMLPIDNKELAKKIYVLKEIVLPNKNQSYWVPLAVWEILHHINTGPTQLELAKNHTYLLITQIATFIQDFKQRFSKNNDKWQNCDLSFRVKYYQYLELVGILNRFLRPFVSSSLAQNALSRSRSYFEPHYNSSLSLSSSSNSVLGGEIFLAQKRYKQYIVPYPPETSTRNSGIWLVKTGYTSVRNLSYELFAGEVYRFLLGDTQPKSRVTRGSTNLDKYQLAIKVIEGFKPFREQPRINNVPSLACVLITSIFLEEIDLKSDNIGVDKEGNVVKIDHGCSIASLYSGVKETELQIAISDLEDPIKLQCIKTNDTQKQSSCFHPHYFPEKRHWHWPSYIDLTQDLNLQERFNQAKHFMILKIILCCDPIAGFIEHILDVNIDSLSYAFPEVLPSEFARLKRSVLNLIKRRHKELKEASNLLGSYLVWRESNASRAKDAIIRQIDDFFEKNKHYPRPTIGIEQAINDSYSRNHPPDPYCL